MKSTFRVDLEASDEQAAALEALQLQFARACNVLAPRVAGHRCWNRVALHHLAYKDLREAFPELGSQMACNAIHAVCRAARIVYQHPRSPFNVDKRGDAPLPRLQFTPKAPVYFDRHTLSLRSHDVSLFTLRGRIRCPVHLSAERLERLERERLVEAVLTGSRERFALSFTLADPAETTRGPRPIDAAAPPLPTHVEVLAAPTLPEAPSPPPTAAVNALPNR